jgi:solute carrier family 35 (UDP-galactose transporter), member B1
VVLNTIQSLFASLTGSIYLFWASKSSSKPMQIFPTKAILPPLLLISITSSLASPFGYASLSHVDYLTFVLAKSCKLLPVIVLHLILFQKSYPLSKYLIVFAVTAGVAIFTLYHPPSASHSAKSHSAPTSSTFGLILLSINLLFDGLTNTIQDHIFCSPARYGRFSGPQMMVAQNILATILTTFYLLFLPYAPPAWIPEMAFPGTLELMRTSWFLSRHPEVLYNVLGFAACGAIGQLFIFATLERFSSLLLVTVTVTRKMLTMLLSVVWFGKRLTPGQWLGVALVFGGVGAEGWEKKREKRRKEAEKKKQ